MSYYRFMLTAAASSLKLLFYSQFNSFSQRGVKTLMHLIRSHFPSVCDVMWTKVEGFYSSSLQLPQ